MNGRISLFAAAICLVAPIASHAQDASPAAPGTCEIHIWAAERFNTLTEGAIWNNTLDSGFNNRPRKVDERGVPEHGPLDSGNQLKMMSALDLSALLHNPGAQIVVHEEPAKRRAVGPATGRQAPSASPCYMELTVAKNFFNRSGLTDRTLRSMFVFDDYGDQAMPRRSFVGWGVTTLVIFPAKQPELAKAADDELANAFRANVAQFAKYAFTPPKKK